MGPPAPSDRFTYLQSRSLTALQQQNVASAVRTSIDNQYADGAGPMLCLGGGTPHKPAILSDTGHVIHEGSAYASYLLKHVSSLSSAATNVSAAMEAPVNRASMMTQGYPQPHKPTQHKFPNQSPVA